MERFEYLVVRAEGSNIIWFSDERPVDEGLKLHSLLNELGSNGWELVAVTESEVTDGGFGGLWGDSHYVQDLFLKRRISS